MGGNISSITVEGERTLILSTIVDICVPNGALLTAANFGYGRIHFAQKFHQIPLSSFLKEISSIREKLKTGKNVLSSEMVRFLPFELATAIFIS